MSEMDKWILGCTIVVALCTMAAVVISLIALNKKQEVQVQQPVSITITEELHKVFASKTEFENHVRDFKEKNGDLWRTLRSEVQRVEVGINEVNKGVAGLKAQTELQNQQLARMDGKLDRLTER